MAPLPSSPRFRRFAPTWLLTLGLVTAGLGFAGCSSDDAAKDASVSGDEQNITDIASTPVKNQAIGNCWVYATTAWTESLHLRGTGEVANLSESWITYWDWYEKLTNYKTAKDEKLATGGFFRSAMTIMGKYGVANEGAFIENEATADRSSAQSRAESAINASMASGALKKSRSPEVVRQELNKAWGLSENVVKQMNATFGEATPRTLTKPAAGFGIFSADTFQIAHKEPGKDPVLAPLRSELGAWEEISPTNTPNQRVLLRRVQKALHDGQPAVVIWNVSWAARSGATFAKMGASNKVDGVHMTLLEDYQAALVPNVGTLPAGVLVTDTKTLDLALADQVEVSFFRVKNSWGASGDPSGTGLYKGYVDLYREYLFPADAAAPDGLVSFVVPKAYDGIEPANLPGDLCSNAPGDATGSYCEKDLGGSNTSLFTCDTGYTIATSACGSSCEGTGTNGDGKAVCAQPKPSPSSANPCEHATDGAGPYCGSSLGLPAGDPDAQTLFSCQKDPSTGAWISPFTSCPSACLPGAPGEADRCK
jgi:hypothetical protein